MLAASAAAHGQNVVKIGFINPLTGPVAADGKDDERGAQLAIAELNAQKVMIGGKPVTLELLSADDQGDPKAGVIAAQQLVDRGAVVVIGHYHSGVNIPAARIYNSAKVVNITPTATNPQLTELGYPYVFRLTTNDDVQSVKLGDYVAQTLKLKRVALVEDRTAYGTGVTNAFAASLKSHNVEMLPREYSNTNTTDFKAILTKLRADKPDALFFGGYYTQASMLARQMKELGIDIPLIGGDGICSPQMTKLAGDILEGRFYCPRAGRTIDKLAGGDDFKKRYRTAFNVDPDVYAPAYYAATYVAVDAMRKAGSAEPEAIQKALRTGEFNSLIGTVRFDSKGEWVNAPVTIFSVSGGVLKPLGQN
ncbi:putative amino acid ABC transporter [Variovorax sp. WDL1]|nr:putative amino acid ABC transporter [Variovorax sp. WDL1]